ncbi:hypothetical protein NGUA15_04739 [Salmonella enterica]|nr:hypothetical protein NGUA15_04739 [Salmonella enterica]
MSAAPGKGWWGVRMTFRPGAVAAAVRRVRRATPLTSMAVNGSSSTHSAARVSHRRASATRRCCPAESRATGTSSNPASPACASASGRRAPSPGWKKCRFSRAVRRVFIPGWCPIHSRPEWKLSRTRRRGSPCQYTSPPSGRASPVSRRSRVVFPAPLPPVTCTHSPASTVNDSPRNSVLSSRSQYRSLASSIPTHQRPVRNLV